MQQQISVIKDAFQRICTSALAEAMKYVCFEYIYILNFSLKLEMFNK